MSGGWLDDGSNTMTGAGPVVSCNTESCGGNVFNALWTGDGSTFFGVHYWEVENRGGLGGVGVTTLARFAEGYGCRCFKFNSFNLSDGGGLLVGEYGSKEFEVGDIVGLLCLCELDTANLTITFYINGRCLGPAFQVASPYPTEVYPVITFDKRGSASIRKVDTAPQSRTREAEATSFPEGYWSLVKDPFVKLDVKAMDGGFHANLSVVNSCFTRLQQTGSGWQAGAVASTRMHVQGPSDVMELERECCAKLEALTNLSYQDGKLVISSPQGDLVFLAATKQLPIPHVGNVLEH
eukprot:GGOE01054077.1.p1 GENE.GGOE01054077.1~~GGOE01054077.1.p1  ORF type:complete len:294 (+),score=32.12 GGOE01054077.1:61-942(+)